MPDGSTLVLIRHGHTAANAEGLHVPMSGWTDLPLSDQGVVDAVRVARQLAVEPAATAAYTSPLQRARHTAQVILDERPMSLALEPDLREIYCGEAEGLPLHEVCRRYPQLWGQNLAENDTEFRWPAGESYRELRERSLAAVQRIASIHPGERVVVVTHTGVISQLVGSIQGVSPACWSRFRPRNGSITELRVCSGKLELVRFDALPSDAPALVQSELVA